MAEKKDIKEKEVTKKEAKKKEPAESKPTYKAGFASTYLNLRSNPGTDSEVLVILKKNENVSFAKIPGNTEWYAVKAGNIEGYCMKEYIVPIK